MSTILTFPAALNSAQQRAALADLVEHGFVILGREADAHQVARAAARSHLAVGAAEQIESENRRLWHLRLR